MNIVFIPPWSAFHTTPSNRNQWAVLAAAVTLPLAVLVLVLVWLGRTAAAILAPGVGFSSN